MAKQSVANHSRSFAMRCTSLPPVFLAPSLQSLQSYHSKLPFTTPNHPFSSTPTSQARLRNPKRNKSRGVSAIRRTGPRVPLSVSKYPLPIPVSDPPSRKDFKTRDDHGLWGFFNKERTAMTTPEELNAHGRAWTYHELANKAWDDLWKIYWSCVKERNWLSTEANERKRVEAGYGDYEGETRDETVSFRLNSLTSNAPAHRACASSTIYGERGAVDGLGTHIR
jgi:large subunit ribosomal protein L47